MDILHNSGIQVSRAAQSFLRVNQKGSQFARLGKCLILPFVHSGSLIDVGSRVALYYVKILLIGVFGIVFGIVFPALIHTTYLSTYAYMSPLFRPTFHV